jgi:hypothetical protein
MVFTSSHICDAFIKKNSNGYEFTNDDWKIIWSSLLFAGARYMSSPEAVNFTDVFIKESEVSPMLKVVHHSISNFPDERYFYQFTPEHQAWLDAVSKQIYEIGFEPILINPVHANREEIFNVVSPLVEHYVFQNVPDLKDIHRAFADIVASSLALAIEEIALQAPMFSLELTKKRYGASQVYFALAIFLFNQTV